MERTRPFLFSLSLPSTIVINASFHGFYFFIFGFGDVEVAGDDSPFCLPQWEVLPPLLAALPPSPHCEKGLVFCSFEERLADAW